LASSITPQEFVEDCRRRHVKGSVDEQHCLDDMHLTQAMSPVGYVIEREEGVDASAWPSIHEVRRPL